MKKNEISVACPAFLENLNENCHHLFGSLYFARTQAGLKKAVKDYANLGNEVTFCDILSYLDFQEKVDFGKLKYPVLIQFQRAYIGRHVTYINIAQIDLKKHSKKHSKKIENLWSNITTYFATS